MDAALGLTIIVPLAGAAVIAGLGRFIPHRLTDVGTIGVAVATTVLCAVVLHRAMHGDVVHWFGGWEPQHGVVIGVSFDATVFGAALATFVGALVVAAAVYSWAFLDEVHALYHAILLVFCAAMVGFCLSGDLFNMFVLFELMSVAAYGLTAYHNEERGPIQGAVNFAITNSVGGFFILFGIALLYGRTRALNLTELGRLLAGTSRDGLAVAALTLLLVGFLVKAAAVPFHFWLADAHAVAPTPVCMLFSGVMVMLGIFGVARVYWSVFAGMFEPSNPLRTVIVTVGVLTAVVGAVMALGQHHLKRLLALSTVSHSGIALIGVGLLNEKALGGAAAYVVGHGLVKASLFATAGIVLHRKGALDEQRLHGRCRNMPATAVLWTIGGLALAGLPPFGTYLGKGLIDEGGAELHATWLVVVGVLASAATGAAVLRAGAHLFLGWGHVDDDATSEGHGQEEERETEGASTRTPVSMALTAGVLLAAALAFGLFPSMARQAVEGADRFVGASSASSKAEPTVSMVVSAAVAVVLAVAIAALQLWRRRLPRPALDAGRRLLPGVRALRRIHSGHVGDYVAWLVFATAMLGVALSAVARAAG